MITQWIESLNKLNHLQEEKRRLPVAQEVNDLGASLLELKKTIDQAGQMIGAFKEELKALDVNIELLEKQKPLVKEAVEKGKIALHESKGQTLKELLQLQQVVTKAEATLEELEQQGEAQAYRQEEIREELERLKKRERGLKLQYNETLKSYLAKKKVYDLQWASLLMQEETLREEIPKSVLSHYDATTRIVSDRPVTYLQEGVCMACRRSVSEHLKRQVAKGDRLTTCENCYRILLPGVRGEEA